MQISIEDTVEGVRYVDKRLQQKAFTQQVLEQGELLANQAAMAILNARRVAELRDQNRKLSDSQRQIERLNEQLGIPAEILIQPTRRKKAA